MSERGASSLLNTLLKLARNHRIWYVAVTFTGVALLHYSDAIFVGIKVPAFLEEINRHSLERIILLIPIIYASFVFGIKMAIASLLVAFFLLLPRALFLSPDRLGALLESFGVLLIGGLVNVWFHQFRKAIALGKSVEAAITSIIDGSPVPIFAIDKNHKVTHWNTAAEILTGIKKEAIIGTDEHWQAFYAEKRPILATLIVDRASPETIEKYYRGKCRKHPLIDGAYEAEDWFPDLGDDGKWLHFTASPLRRNNKSIRGAIVTLQDITERKKAEENLHYYLQEITRAQEEERKRIALDLHDSTVQSLTALLHQLDNFLADKVNISVKESRILWGLHEQIRGILQEVRRFSRDLRPSILDDLGLLPALDWLVSEIKNTYEIETRLETNSNEQRLTQEAELILFRIAQEALNNVARHARASQVIVRVDISENKITLNISDNGIGFELPGKYRELEGRLGLAGMQERVKLLCGSLEINSELGKGTTVFVNVPTSCILTEP